MKNYFNTRLRELRKANHLSQSEMARRLESSQSSYSAWEKGATEPDNCIATLLRICSEFNVSADWLIGRSDIRDGAALSAAPPARAAEAPPPSYGAPCCGCSERDKRIDSLLSTLNNLSAGRSPAHTLAPSKV